MLTDLSIAEWAKRNVTKDRAELELWRRWMRSMCRTNLYFLCREVLHNEDMDPDYHGRVCRRLNTWPTKEDGSIYFYRADYRPRGGFKTTIGTVGVGIQTNIRCPEETMLIEHGIQDKAIEIGMKIRQHYQDNELLKWLFPDIIYSDCANQSPRWNAMQLQLKRRGKYSEPTFSFSSAESTSTGGHYTLVLLDDLVTETNSQSDDQRDKVYDHFEKISFLRDERIIKKGGGLWWPWMPDYLHVPFRVSIQATRWHIKDMNSRLIDPEGPYSGDVNFVIQSSGLKEGKSFFPTRFPLHELAAMRKRMGPVLYSAQMDQDPYPEDAQLLDAQSLATYDETTLPKYLWKYTTIDPTGITESDKLARVRIPNDAAVMTVGISQLGNIYILRIDKGRFNPTEHVKRIFQHVRDLAPRKLGLEASSYQATLGHWMKECAKTEDIQLPQIILMKRGGPETKTKRILAIDPPLGAGRIYYNPKDPNQKALFDEMRLWTGSSDDTDDLLDCLADAIVIGKKPPLEIERGYAKPSDAALSKPKTFASSRTSSGSSLLKSIGVGNNRRHVVPRRRGRWVS